MFLSAPSRIPRAPLKAAYSIKASINLKPLNQHRGLHNIRKKCFHNQGNINHIYHIYHINYTIPLCNPKTPNSTCSPFYQMEKLNKLIPSNFALPSRVTKAWKG